MVVGVLKLYFNIDDNKDEEPWVDMKSIPLVLISVGLMFLVVFRTQTTYAKWNTARTAWVNIAVACRDLAMQCSVYMHDFDAASAMCRYLVVFVISVRFWLRSEDLCEELVRPILAHQGYQYLEERSEASALQQRIDDDDSLTFQFKRVCAPLPVLEVLRTILEHAADHGSIGPFHTMMEGNFKQMSTALATMERVLDTQIPFAYITHVRTAILLYSLAIPFFLTREIGWFTVLFVAFYCYVVMGLENLAVEIENPFGTDANDLPMDAYCCKIARDVTDILKRKQAVLSHTTRERHDRGDRD
jgi:putative membrane protein